MKCSECPHDRKHHLAAGPCLSCDCFRPSGEKNPEKKGSTR